MYLTGRHDTQMNRLHALPTGINDINSYVNEARNWVASGVITSSGFLKMLEAIS
jgi:hypothetical protein